MSSSHSVENGDIPQDMPDAIIVTVYFYNGDRSDWNNYSGIFLLSTIVEVFA